MSVKKKKRKEKIPLKEYVTISFFFFFLNRVIAFCFLNALACMISWTMLDVLFYIPVANEGKLITCCSTVKNKKTVNEKLFGKLPGVITGGIFLGIP